MTGFTVEMPILLTEREAAQHLGISQRRLTRLRESGGLPFIPGRTVLVQLSHVRAVGSIFASARSRGFRQSSQANSSAIA